MAKSQGQKRPRDWAWIPLVLSLAFLAKEIRDNHQLSEKLTSLSKRVEILEVQTPGLGEYMTTLQLHMGKLWFAGKAANWDLAGYELDELKETMEAAETLHAVKNNVDTASVIDSTVKSQVEPMGRAIQKHDLPGFKKLYGETLTACNKCHEATDHGFNVITIPANPPVWNQAWVPKGK